MGLACGEELKGIAMSDNGGWEKHKAMEFMFGSMGIVMKEISKLA
jgi:hypothetical protein